MTTKHELEAAQWERVAELCMEVPIGLCVGVARSSLLMSDRYSTRFSMWRRIDGYMKPGTAWAYPVNDWGECRDKDREARCLAALWLAEDARHGVPVIEATTP